MGLVKKNTVVSNLFELYGDKLEFRLTPWTRFEEFEKQIYEIRELICEPTAWEFILRKRDNYDNSSTGPKSLHLTADRKDGILDEYNDTQSSSETVKSYVLVPKEYFFNNNNFPLYKELKTIEHEIGLDK